jgi:hypothetical protein
MAKMVLGVFIKENDAEMAIHELKDVGYNAKDISIVMRYKTSAEGLRESTGVNVAEGAVSGATAGGVLGGLAGLLIGIGAVTIPGIGALLIGGPLAAALGLSGAAATTVSGAVTGALAGGLVGSLMGLGIPEEEARVYEDRIKEGAILVAVPAREGNVSEAMNILEDFGADQVRSIDVSDKYYDRDREIDYDRRDIKEEPRRERSQPAAFFSDIGRALRGKKKEEDIEDEDYDRDDSGKGWHDESEEHAEAARGRKVRR